jgi:hypothetical protein
MAERVGVRKGRFGNQDHYHHLKGNETKKWSQLRARMSHVRDQDAAIEGDMTGMRGGFTL